MPLFANNINLDSKGVPNFKLFPSLISVQPHPSLSETFTIGSLYVSRPSSETRDGYSHRADGSTARRCFA